MLFVIFCIENNTLNMLPRMEITIGYLVKFYRYSVQAPSCAQATDSILFSIIFILNFSETEYFIPFYSIIYFVDSIVVSEFLSRHIVVYDRII